MMKFFKHLGVVLKHKYNVVRFASKLGIFWTGLVHDLTKFTPEEFNRSVKYFHGKKSPTIIEREYHDNFSYICVRHTGRNKHHWQYWVDYTRDEIVVNRIPYRNNLEYAADVLSASKVYNPKEFTLNKAYDYFKDHSSTYLMHPASKEFVLWCIKELADNGQKRIKKSVSKKKYLEISSKYPNTIIFPIYCIDFRHFEIK